MRQNIYLTVHEFAELHHVNKRTLHYYDSIGLFSPKKVGENHYRYYTYAQCAEFEIILALRELGMSIEEIKACQKDRDSASFSQVLLEKSREIREKIRRLENIEAILNERRAGLLLSQSPQVDRVDVVDLPEEYLLLTDISALTGAAREEADESIYASLAKFWAGPKPMRPFNSSYGSMLPVPAIAEGRFDAYEYLFIRIPPDYRSKSLFRKPGGPYLRGFCRGSGDDLPRTYARILDYARTHGLKPLGFAYEEGINDLGIATEDQIGDYVTQITLPCSPC